MGSLFQPATETARHLKVLLHGGPGVGKTRAALSFPGKVAVIDLEGGTALYSGFDVLRTKDLARVEAAITEIGQSGHYATLVIDPLTVIWQLLQDAGQGVVDRRAGKSSLESGQALTTREWGLIKRKYASILTRLNNLPLHVVLIARDTDLYEGSGDQLKRIGVKADVEKSTPYVADLVLRVEAPGGKRVAIVEKSRAAGLTVDQRLTGWAADAFYATCLAPVLGAVPTTGAAPLFEEDSTVVAGNAALLEAAPVAAPVEEKAPVPLTEYYDRIGTHLTRLHITGAGVGNMVGALTDGKHTTLTDITDRALLKKIGLTLAGMKTDDDLQRFWAEHDGPTRTWARPPMAAAESGEAT